MMWTDVRSRILIKSKLHRHFLYAAGGHPLDSTQPAFPVYHRKCELQRRKKRDNKVGL